MFRVTPVEFPICSVRAVVVLLSGAAFGLGMACTTVLPNHCANLAGDQTCASRRSAFCSSCVLEGDGCTDERPSDECYFPGLETETTASDSASEGSSSSSATSTSEGAGESSMTEPMVVCTSAADCTDAEAPFCNLESGLCVSCEGMPEPDAACAEVDPMLPVCFEGECVACTPEKPALCDAQLLLCDGTSNTCGPCTEHEPCASGACDIFVGTCFDPATVVEVGGAGEPTLAEGLAVLEGMWPDALGERRGVLVVHEGVNFDEVVTLEAGSLVDTDANAIAFMAAPGESPEWNYTTVMPASPILTVAGTTRTYLDGMALRGNPGTTGWGLRCADGRVDVRRSRIVANSGGGIEADGSCELRLENSFVGGDENDRDAVSIEDAEANVTIVYSTLGAGFGTAAALRCVANAGVEVRNALLVARTSGSEVVCPSADLMSSAWELGALNTGWFADYATGDFHLTGLAPAGIRVADWQEGDPATDIDGEDRVTVDDEPDHAGADVP